MRVLNYAVEGKAANLSTVAVDAPTEGGACHHYHVRRAKSEGESKPAGEVLAEILFQCGPIKEGDGVNGVQNEDLIAIVIDRLRGFQSGKFACRENAIALTKLEEALMWLNKRTSDRIARSVEGTHQK